MSNKRISELQIEVNPQISDLVALASDGQSKKTTLGSILNSELPSTFGTTTINGDLNVNGNLNVSTIVSASVLYESGSTLFGNSYDDIHQFTGSVNISGSLSDIHYMDFDTSATQPNGTPGRLRWNDVDGTLDLTLKRGNVTLQIGQEQHINAYNATPITLLESEHRAVYISGSISNFPAVIPASNQSRRASENTIGVVTENILSGETGFVTTQGLVRNIDMSQFSAGDTLYLGANDGLLINQPPLPPALTVIIGYCIDPSESGSMFVNVRSGFEYPQYAIAYNTTDHSASLADTEELVDLNTPSVLSGISLTDGTRFTVSTPGLYEFVITSQLERVAGSGTAQVYFWAKKNGTNVDNTGTQVAMFGNSNTSAVLVTKNLVLVLEANDYVEIAWGTTDTNIHLKSFPASTSPLRPLTPSVKITATRIT